MEIALPVNVDADFASVLPQRRSNHRRTLPVTNHDHSFVTHSGIGLKRLRPIGETFYSNVSPWIQWLFYRHALSEYFTTPRVRLDTPNLLLLHNHWGGGYHHWVADCLVKLKEVDPSRYAVLLPADYPPFALESLQLFPFRSVVHIPPRHGVYAEQLTIVANPKVSRYNATHIRWLRDVLVESEPGPACDRIYITRRQARWRLVDNEDEVIALLRHYGFSVVDSASLDFRTEVQTFARCKILVSLHGAGMTNCVFMPHAGHVLELYRELDSKRDAMNTTYWHLCNAAGVNYYYQFCRAVQNSGVTPNDADVVVDIALLERNVQTMLRASGES